MKWNVKEFIKFLFPEWQVVEKIKTQGFIAKRGKSNVMSNMNENQRIKSSQSSTGNKKILPKMDALNVGKKKGLQVSHENGNAPVFSKKKNYSLSDENVDNAFQTIRMKLEDKMIGQKNYLDQLCLAFKRPFVTGSDKNKPKNTMVLFGDNGSGRRISVSHMMKFLREHKLVTHETVSILDLASYTTTSEYQLFLTDLYKCLYGSSDVILFENIDKAPSNVLDAITQLTLTGKYMLPSRYTLNENNLVEATGMLLHQSISEIHSNEKYFVFLYEKSEESILQMLGSNFIDSIGDLIHTDPYSADEKEQLVIRSLNTLQEKCGTQLSMQVKWEKDVIAHIVAHFTNSTDIAGIETFVDQKIFRALAEYKLKSNKLLTTVHLTQNDGILIAKTSEETVRLDEFLRNTIETGVEDIKKELDKIVGIKAVKEYVLQLEDNLKVQEMRQSKGFDKVDISMHMVFTGNPGTGKTTIARIVAKYLKAIGVVSTGQLREVTRADLVGEYVGQTARLTNDVIKSALGGVLFIDEAYALYRDDNDTFGIEAIDTLVKGMEDHRDELIVILAGYSNEMELFLNSNPGLKSRFPNIVHFEDYTSEEMWEIAQIIAKQKGYEIMDDCQGAMIQLFDKSQIKGRNDGGNGRLVRNTIEAAILNQSQRLVHDPEAKLDQLTYEDFKFEDLSSFDLEASLTQIIGLENVKEFIRTQQSILIAQEKRRKAGLVVDATQSLHMIFSGNPGTGKTTIARIVASMFKEMGLLKSGHLVEVDSGGLTGQYAGHTAKRTEEVFRSALGGVLFIDEAYALTSNGNSYGTEAINTLVKLLEDYREDIVIILAGYEKEMKDFLKANTGLESRFPLKIQFPDYKENELFEIAKMIISYKGFILAKEAESILLEQITKMHKQSTSHSGNGRMVRNYVEEITRNQSARIAINDVTIEEMNVILPTDIRPTERLLKNFDLETELASIIGLDEVKDYIRSLNARLRMQSERKKLGLPIDETQTLHMIFKGNPGTGKTMMARIIASVLYNLGIIQTNNLVETDRANLVAGYVGQTAIKSKEVIMEAIDGVLFIDEAYALAQGGPNDFGKEAIDTLVKMMDDHRDRLVVILAGYNEDMEQFLDLNSGLRSRFPNIVSFSDYSPEQLLEIAEKFYNEKRYVLTGEATEKLFEILSDASRMKNFGNGRYVRNIYERSLNNQASRLSNHTNLTEEELIKITAADIEGM